MFRVVNEVLVAVLVYSILTCIQVPCTIHTAKTGLLRCCLKKNGADVCFLVQFESSTFGPNSNMAQSFPERKSQEKILELCGPKLV